jgi:hypothetical protein
MKIMANWLCSILGHEWTKKSPVRRICLRCGEEMVVYSQYSKEYGCTIFTWDKTIDKQLEEAMNEHIR